MGGKVWSAEEEDYFWEVIVPQAPAGLDSVSKQAKKEVHLAWAPLSSQMEREMTKRLKPEECLRRKYTPIGCYEHYFQNYINSHYSPHAKALVLKYKNGLKTAASIASSHRTTDDEASSHMSYDPVADLSRVKARPTASFEASYHMNYSNGAAAPMPEAHMPLFQGQDSPSSMQILCDAALAIRRADSLQGKDTDEEDEDMTGRSRRKVKRPASVLSEDADNTVDASIQPGLVSKPPARRETQKTQRDQRRTRKAAHRYHQASDASSSTTAVDPFSPSSGGSPSVQDGYYSSPMMYGHPGAYFGYHHTMQNAGPHLQNTNMFQSNHVVPANGFHPYGGPAQLGSVPGFIHHPYFAFGGHDPQHSTQYMGGYHNSEFTQHNSQGFGKGLAHMNKRTGQHGGKDGNAAQTSPSFGPVEKDPHGNNNE